MTPDDAAIARVKESQRRLSWFVTDAPLYRIVKVSRGVSSETVAKDILPKKVRMQCDECQGDATNWAISEGGHGKANTLTSVVYQCQNCQNSQITMYFYFTPHQGELHLEKIGQFPKFEVKPPKELSKALGKHRTLYIKGVTLRHHNYGLGALIYFRRLVEETADELLDLLENVALEAEGSNQEALAVIKQARKAQRFEDKVKVAAEALPQHLRSGGMNPLGLLHDLLSYDIHEGTDEDAIEIVDEMDKILEYLFTELKIHAQTRTGYTESIKKLAAKRDERKQKGKSG